MDPFTTKHSLLPSDPHSPSLSSRLSTAITCDSCGGNCTGEVLKVQDKHFHIQCFTCKGESDRRLVLSQTVYF